MKTRSKWICTFLICWFIAEPLVFAIFNLEERMELFMEFSQEGALLIGVFIGAIFGGNAIKSKLFNKQPRPGED